MINEIRSKILNNLDKVFKDLNESKIPVTNEIINDIKKNIKNYENNYDNTINFSNMIDHTYLKTDCTYKKIEQIIEEAEKNNFASICIPPSFISYAKKLKKNVPLCTVIGFPLGYSSKESKITETINAINDGADEIDMVLNIAFIKNKEYYYLYEEMKEIKKSAGSIIVKLILETCDLTFEEKLYASIIAFIANIDFLKTSTGFSTSGAKLEDIILMKMIFKDREVKASGGVRTTQFVKELIQHGVTRIGTSSSLKLINNEKINNGY